MRWKSSGCKVSGAHCVSVYFDKKTLILKVDGKHHISETKSFSLVIFTFYASEEKRRRQARELLKYFGFKLIAQNVYIRRKITHQPFDENVKALGLENNIFLFDCDDPGTKMFRERLFAQFKMDETVRRTNEFKSDLGAFLPPGL